MLSANSDSSSPKGLLICLGWLGAKKYQIEKYKAIYEKYGFQVNCYVTSVDASAFNVIRLNPHARRILSDIQNFYDSLPNSSDPNFQRPPLYIHCWSNGGGFVVAKMNALIANNPEKYCNIKYRGIIYDSTPGKTELKRLSVAVLISINDDLTKSLMECRCCGKAASCMKYIGYTIGFLIKWIILLIFGGIIWPLILIIGILYTHCTCEYSFIKNYIDILLWGDFGNNNDNNKCTQVIKGVNSLHISCEPGVDVMCPNEHNVLFMNMKKDACKEINQEYIESWDKADELMVKKENNNNNDGNDEKDDNGNEIKEKPILIVHKTFENSQHVLHYKKYKDEYTKLVQRFIDYCNDGFDN